MLESSSRFFHWRLALIAILVMVVAVIPYHIAHSLITTIRIGKNTKRETVSIIFIIFHHSSAKSLLKCSDSYPLARVSLLLLANRGSISITKR